jgi:nucleotide-binding universal stress UspA family protein
MYKRILVPLDGSKEAEYALTHVKTAATGYTPPAKVVLFAAIEPFLGVDVDATWSKEYDKFENKFEQSATQHINRASEILGKEGLDVDEVIIDKLGGQDVADEILKYADNEDVDLIIMTTHGRTGIKRWAFGSVTDKVVRHSKVPVLVIPPHGYR